MGSKNSSRDDAQTGLKVSKWKFNLIWTEFIIELSLSLDSVLD